MLRIAFFVLIMLGFWLFIPPTYAQTNVVSQQSSAPGLFLSFLEGAVATAIAIVFYFLGDRIWKRRLKSPSTKQDAISFPSWRGMVCAAIILATITTTYTLHTKQLPLERWKFPGIILFLGLSYFFDAFLRSSKQKKN